MLRGQRDQRKAERMAKEPSRVWHGASFEAGVGQRRRSGGAGRRARPGRARRTAPAAPFARRSDHRRSAGEDEPEKLSAPDRRGLSRAHRAHRPLGCGSTPSSRPTGALAVAGRSTRSSSARRAQPAARRAGAFQEQRHRRSNGTTAGSLAGRRCETPRRRLPGCACARRGGHPRKTNLRWRTSAPRALDGWSGRGEQTRTRPTAARAVRALRLRRRHRRQSRRGRRGRRDRRLDRLPGDHQRHNRRARPGLDGHIPISASHTARAVARTVRNAAILPAMAGGRKDTPTIPVARAPRRTTPSSSTGDLRGVRLARRAKFGSHEAVGR